MINIIKEMRRCSSTLQVLDFIKEAIKEIEKGEQAKFYLGINNELRTWQRIEKIGYLIALKKALNTLDYELCAEAIEKNYVCDEDNADDWAQCIRLKAYGSSFLDKFLSYHNFDGFNRFAEEELKRMTHDN